MMNVFVGFDPRESIAFHVFSNSILRHSSRPVSITPLALKNLEGYTENHSDGSNQFIYSRFLVPSLMNYKGWALFADGDMLMRSDITQLFELCDNTKAVMVVKHDYKTSREVKYLGAPNQNYPRKNWSSVVLWNCSHELNKNLTPEFIEKSTGAELHRFTWLPDELIGELPIEWNWLPDEFGENPDARLLHFTLGTPCFFQSSNEPMSNEWHAERMLVNHSDQVGLDGFYK